jgi:hypothetical protein
MSFVQKSFKEVWDECYNWSIHATEREKKMQCNLKGLDVTIIFTRMVYDDNEGLKVPNRINISSADPKIVNLFKKKLCQPKSIPNWDERLWVNLYDTNITLPHLQYELRFFSSENELMHCLNDNSKYHCKVI